MTKPQMWIAAAAVAVVALITGIKHFGGSATEEESALPRPLTQRDTKTEHNGWSVRANSDDLTTSDDVRVQRRLEAKPGSIAAQRGEQPSQPRGGQGATTGSAAAPAAAPSNDAADAEANAGNDVPIAKAAGARSGSAGSASSGSGIGAANGGTGAPAGALSDMNMNSEPHGGTQAGTQLNPARDQQAQPTPPAGAPSEELVGAIYDSKDTTFSVDTGAELKDIGNLPGPGVTMKMQLAADWTANNQDDADFLKLGDNLELTKNVTFMGLAYTDSAGNEHRIGSDMTTWAAMGIEQPWDVQATVNGNQLILTVNGKVVSQGSTPGLPYDLPSNPALTIGCVDYPPSRPCAGGGVSGVMIR